MANNITIISANKRPVRVGSQVAPADGSSITVDLDDPIVRRHLDVSRGEWLQLDSEGSGGGESFADKTLVGRWSTHTLPGNNSTRVIIPDGTNVAQTSANCRRGAFRLRESDIAGTLDAGKKLTFYAYMYATFTQDSPVSGGNAEFSAGIRRAGANGRWVTVGTVNPATPDMYPQSPAITPSIDVDYEWDDEADFFEDNPSADGDWFIPTFTIQSLGGTLEVVNNGFLMEIALYAKINDV